MTRINTRLLIGVVAALALTACGGQNKGQEPDKKEIPALEGNSFAISNVTIFDGGERQEGQSIIVQDGHIVAVVEETIPSDLVTFDGTGKTLLPGLIDAHVHAFDETSLKDALRFGVTTELDMFSAVSFASARKAERDNYDKTDMADLYSAFTLVTSEGGHGTQFGLDIPVIGDPAMADAFVKARLAEGSDYIKIVYEPNNPIVTSISKEILEAVIKAAHDQGAMAIVHISTLQAAKDAVAAKADGLVHIFADKQIDQDLITSMQDNNVFVIPTLSVIASVANRGLGQEFIEDERFRPYLSPIQIDGLGLSLSGGRDLSDRFNLDIALENTRLLHEAGITILAGTDAPNPGTAHGVSIHGELVLLTRAGFSPSEALAAATQTNAMIFKLEGRGAIAPEARADLLLVEGDPTKDIMATRDISLIFKNGYLVERAEQISTVASAQKPSLNDGFISRFEKGLSSAFGVDWITTTDQLANGQSTATLTKVDTGALDSSGALRIDGTISTKFFFPWSGAGIFFSEDFSKSYDFSDYQTLQFYARGDARDLSVMFFTRTSRQRPATSVVKIDGAWQLYEIDLEAVRGAAMDEVYGLAITAGRPKGTFYFELDDVQLR